MTRANTPVFIDGTDRNDIVHFKDYEANPKKVKSELKKIKRSFTKNDDRIGPTVAKKRYNNVTHNYEDQFPAEVDDKIKAVEEYEKSSESKILKFNESISSEEIDKGSIQLEPGKNYYGYVDGDFYIRTINGKLYILKPDCGSVEEDLDDSYYKIRNK